MINEQNRRRRRENQFVEPQPVKDLGETDSLNKSLELMRKCVTPHGFQAAYSLTPEKVVMADSGVKNGTNYPNVWSRDGVINGLSALVSGDPPLIECFRQNLLTLARHQDASGAIPSNVNPNSPASQADRDLYYMGGGEGLFKPSFGGTVGRIDASTWFVIGAGQYAKHTQDKVFLEGILPAAEKAMGYLRAMETNGKGMLFVPRGGNWADEYVIEGYTLYDNVLYQRSLTEYAQMLGKTGGDGTIHGKRAERVKDVLQAVLWPKKDGEKSYHPGLQQSLKQKAEKEGFWQDDYFMGAFGPGHEFTRFDSLGNYLAVIFDVATIGQAAKILDHAEKISDNPLGLTPAFHPVIDESDPEYGELKKIESLGFKNHPHQYHNGGIWPMNNGFRTLAEAHIGRMDKAGQVAQGIERAVAVGDYGHYEYLDGQTLGVAENAKRNQGWSAAANIMSQKRLAGEKIFL